MIFINSSLGFTLIELCYSPPDPSGGTAGNTLYTIYQDTNGRIIATASSELSQGTIIQVQR